MALWPPVGAGESDSPCGGGRSEVPPLAPDGYRGCSGRSSKSPSGPSAAAARRIRSRISRNDRIVLLTGSGVDVLDIADLLRSSPTPFGPITELPGHPRTRALEE